MPPDTDPVVTRYQRGDLMARIRAALAAAGHDPDAPDVTALAGLDHLHGGGFHTTEVQARLAGIPRGSHVLDAGCGIGGPIRYLAHAYGRGFPGIRDLMAEAGADPGGAHRTADIGPVPAMGDDMPLRLANVTRALAEGRLMSMLLVARKP